MLCTLRMLSAKSALEWSLNGDSSSAQSCWSNGSVIFLAHLVADRDHAVDDLLQRSFARSSP
jgi:hypothetical protein